MGLRHTKFGWWKDQQGAVINAETLTVYLSGTTTVATIYEASAGGSAIPNGAITLSNVGFFQYWVDEDDYPTTQRFKHVFTGAKFDTITTDPVVIFPGITASSSDTLTNKTIDADDNTISNLEIGAEVKAIVVAILNMDGFDISNIGVAFLKEQAAAEANVAGSGQLWVKTATPNVLMFSDDTGADFVIVHTLNKLSVFAATTSAELAGVISDESGSGALVFAISPTLVTPVIGDASGTSLTLTGTTETDTNTLTKKNIVKAFGNFNGTGTPAYNGTTSGSYNMTSTITDTAQGRWTVSFDTDMADTNYCLVFGAVGVGGTTARIPNMEAGTKAVGSVGIGLRGVDNAEEDEEDISFLVMGNQ